MDCYGIANPKDGQVCNDDQLGQLTYNAADGTWEALNYVQPANWIANVTSFIPAVFKSNTAGSNGSGNNSKWGWIILIALIVIGLYYALFKK